MLSIVAGLLLSLARTPTSTSESPPTHSPAFPFICPPNPTPLPRSVMQYNSECLRLKRLVFLTHLLAERTTNRARDRETESGREFRVGERERERNSLCQRVACFVCVCCVCGCWF